MRTALRRREGYGLPSCGIILVQPKFPENIGAAARIACNFGIPRMFVVSDERYDEERMLKMATHKAAFLIHEIRYCATVAEAASSFQIIVGTTARQGRRRLEDQSPREVMARVAPHVKANQVALMFGSETSGLTNEDLDFCQYASTIPTADFSSLNLAQAVAIHAYELYTALYQAPFAETPKSEFANSHELEGMYNHIEEALDTITFLRDTNHVFWMRNIRQFLGRMQLKKKETSLIRGVCRKLLWYSKRREKAGKNETQGPVGLSGDEAK